MPPPPAFAIYERAAAIERRSVELARERQSQRIRKLGREIAATVETIADERAA